MNLLKLLLVIIFSPSNHILPPSKEDEATKAGATTIQKKLVEKNSSSLTLPSSVLPSVLYVLSTALSYIAISLSCLHPSISVLTEEMAHYLSIKT